MIMGKIRNTSLKRISSENVTRKDKNVLSKQFKKNKMKRLSVKLKRLDSSDLRSPEIAQSSKNFELVSGENSSAQKHQTKNEKNVNKQMLSNTEEDLDSRIIVSVSQEIVEEKQEIQLKFIKEKTPVNSKDKNVLSLRTQHEDSSKKNDDIENSSIVNESIPSRSRIKSSALEDDERQPLSSVVEIQRSSNNFNSPNENKMIKRTSKSRNRIVNEKENISTDQTPLKPRFLHLNARKALSQSFDNIQENDDNDINVEDFKSPANQTVFKSRKKNNDSSNVRNTKDNKKSESSLESMQTKNDDNNDIYEFQSSQTSASEKDDTFLKQLEKQGKVIIKHRRRKKIKEATKKKYINPVNIWHDIEKNLGLNHSKLKTLRSKKNDKQSTNNESTTSVTNKNESNKIVRFDDEIEVISVPNEKSVKFPTKESTVNHSINSAVTTKTDNSILSIDKEQSINDSTKNITLSTSSSLYPTIRTPQNKPRNKEELLEYARNYVKNQTKSSTPISNKQTNKENTEMLSPILPSSPWRINMRTATAPSQKNNSDVQINENSPTMKNVSNVENIPPISFEQTEQNKSITIMRQNLSTMDKLNNTKTNMIARKSSRTSVAQRNPLKQINIIEIVDLPSLPLRDKKMLESSSINNITSNFPNDNRSLQVNDSVSNFFGFDEIEEIGEETENSSVVIPDKAKLKRKLKKLKKLLPPTERSLIKYKKIPSIFNEPNTKRQANIRQMLSSTTKSNITKNTVDSFVSESDEEPTILAEETDCNNDDSIFPTNNLFDDPIEPETTLDATKIKRTYSRHSKSKPKKYFILFSDESEDESEPETIDEKKKRKNRKKKQDQKVNEPELNKFIEEFNSICDEAENYELVTETENSTFVT